jgi:hypothetical protein
MSILCGLVGDQLPASSLAMVASNIFLAKTGDGHGRPLSRYQKADTTARTPSPMANPAVPIYRQCPRNQRPSPACVLRLMRGRTNRTRLRRQPNGGSRVRRKGKNSRTRKQSSPRGRRAYSLASGPRCRRYIGQHDAWLQIYAVKRLCD